MVLKPQDVVVALKLLEYEEERPPFAQMAEELAMSSSEVHAAVKRAQAAHLVHGPELGERPNYRALEEFLIHGIKYVFPAQHGAMTRGLPTSYAAEPLKKYIKAGNEPLPVWPSASGLSAVPPLSRCIPVFRKQPGEIPACISCSRWLTQSAMDAFGNAKSPNESS